VSHLRFVVIGPRKGKVTAVHEVYSNESNEYLGKICWYGGWRQYVLDIDSGTRWSKGCLLEVGEYIAKLMAERR
jgi:hypothetical protein